MPPLLLLRNAAIDASTSLVPSGAFILTPGRTIEPNGSFKGLNPSEAGGLAGLLHFRPPRAPHRQQALAKGGLLPAGACSSSRCALSLAVLLLQ